MRIITTAALLTTVPWAFASFARAESGGPGGAIPGSSPASPPEPVAAYRSIHERELDRHRLEPPRVRALPDRDTLRQGAHKTVNRIVYGYLPYWVNNLDSIRWSALTHLAWFAVEMDPYGDVTARHGWPDQVAVEAAHLAGVRVDLTFTLFSGADILALTSDPERRANAVAHMVDELEAGGADGISVDFEGLSDGTRPHFTAFIAELRAELERRGHAGAGISIAGPAVNWVGSDGVPEFDLDALLEYADIFFIMGYGYFWSGSSRAGPTGIVWLSPEWRPYQNRSMLRTLADYSKEIPAYKRSRIVWGVPYYGNEWITDSDTMGASVIDHVSSVTYQAARADLSAGRTRLWDEGGNTPWYAWQESGSFHQVYYDDEDSLATKYRLALDQDLGGVGMWALNYDAGYQELWDLIEATFSTERAPEPGHYLDPIAIESFPYHDEGDTRAAPSSYFNFYSCDPTVPEYGREVVYQIDVCTSGALTAHVPVDAWVDPDLHLLTDTDQDACVARAHTDLSAGLEPGRYYLVVDTWVNDLVTTEGPYTLDVLFSPDADGAGCPASQTCNAGVCACLDPGLAVCAEACVDTSSDSAHCGACDHACTASETCVGGACVAAPEPPAGTGGCGCRVDARAPTRAHGLGFLVVGWLLVLACLVRSYRSRPVAHE